MSGLCNVRVNHVDHQTHPATHPIVGGNAAGGNSSGLLGSRSGSSAISICQISFQIFRLDCKIYLISCALLGQGTFREHLTDVDYTYIDGYVHCYGINQSRLRRNCIGTVHKSLSISARRHSKQRMLPTTRYQTRVVTSYMPPFDEVAGCPECRLG